MNRLLVKSNERPAPGDVVRSQPESPSPINKSAPGGESAPSMSRRRIYILAGVLGFMALSVVGGWLAGSQIESPAEAAARTAPPTPSPILVPVEKRVLSSSIVTRGTARFGLPQPAGWWT